jgi:hypothetical protein
MHPQVEGYTDYLIVTTDLMAGHNRAVLHASLFPLLIHPCLVNN